GQTRVALATLELAVLVEAAVALAGLALAWALSGVVATRLFGDPTLQALITLGALTLVLTAFDRTARAALRVFDRVRLLSLCSALEAVARLALIAGALARGARVRGVLLAYLAADFGAAALLLAVAGREVRRRLGALRVAAPLAAIRSYRSQMLAFAGHSSVRATLKLATRRLDLLLLGHYRSPAEVGLYRAALRLTQVLEDLTDPLYFAASPLPPTSPPPRSSAARGSGRATSS